MVAPGPSILLVTVDCLRRDRISAYGHGRPTTPFIDSLLDSSRHFTSAHAASSWTCPSVVSMLTGLYPHRHGGGVVLGDPKELSRANLPTILDAGIPTLPEALGVAGYATASFTAVWMATLPIPGRFGLEVRREVPASKLAGEALGWIREQDGPFLCWLHLGDTHDPLEATPPAREAMGVCSWRSARRWAFTGLGEDISNAKAVSYIEDRRRAYDAAVRSVDDVLASLWSRLGREDVVLALTSDHGEEMWEHRDEEVRDFADPRGLAGVGHGHNLFQVHLLVPLVLRGPGIDAGAVSENVSLVDLAPTIAGLVGIPTARDLDGVSLLERPGPSRAIVAEAIAYGHDKASVIEGDRKLLVSGGDGYERAFALGKDRTETGPIEEPEAIAGLRSHLPAEVEARGVSAEANADIEERLRDLGYID